MISRRNLLSGAAGFTASAILPRPAGSAAVADSMYKSILIRMLPAEMSYLDRFKLAVEVDFKHMEAQTLDDDQEAIRIKDAADKAGLQIHSVMNMAHWDYPLSSPKPDEVEISMKGMEKSLRQAKLYGAEAVLLVPAVVREDTTYEQAWERSQKQIRKLIPLAEKLGVIIAVEEVWNKFLLTARDFNQYIDEFNSPMIQAYFDVGNIVHHGIPEHWIRQLGKRIVKVHLKDYHRDTRRVVNLGEGHVNWAEVQKAFREIGYKGAVTVELGSGGREHLADLAERVDRLLGLAG